MVLAKPTLAGPLPDHDEQYAGSDKKQTETERHAPWHRVAGVSSSEHQSLPRAAKCSLP
jgi:hypothetical protein